MKLSQEDIHNSHFQVVADEQHLRDVHILLELPSIVSNVGEFWLHKLDVLFGEEPDGRVEILWPGRSSSLRVVSEEIAYEKGHVAIGRVLETHPYESISLDQRKAHLWCLPLQIIEYHPHLQSRQQVTLEAQDVVIVLCLAGRPDYLLKVLHLIGVVDDPAYLFELLHAIEDMQTLEDMVFVQFIEDFEEDILVGSDDGLGDFIVLVEQTPCDLNYIVNSILVPLEERQCEGREAIIEGQSIVADDDPLPVIDEGLLLDEPLNHVEVAALSISLVILCHFGQHEHEEGRILLKGHLRPILRQRVIDLTNFSTHETLLLAEPLDEQFHGLMAFAESSEHVVEVTIIDFELVLDVVFKLVDHHILGCLLHLLEDLVHIVVIFGFLVLVAVVVGVVEEDQLEFLP